jgi:membrane protease YdiL (CAAX protease family)
MIVAGFVIGSIVTLVLLQALIGNVLDSELLQKELLNPANSTAVKIVQLVSSFLMFFVPAVVFARIVNREPMRYLGVKTRSSWIQAGLVLIIVFLGFTLSGALGEFTTQVPIPKNWEIFFKKMEKTFTDQVMVIANMKSVGDYFFTLIVIAVAPAIFEEILFRGALQQLMVKWTRNAWIGIIITSIIFSAIHFSYYGFLSRVALGMVLGFLFHYSKSLWLPILAHFLNNGAAVTMMYIMSRQGKMNMDALDEKFPIWWGAIALAGIIVLLIVYRNECKRLGTYHLDLTLTKSDDPFSGQYVSSDQKQ